MTLLEKIETLNVQGNNNKIEALKKLKDDCDFMQFLTAFYDPSQNLYIRKMPKINKLGEAEIDGQSILDFVLTLSQRVVTGNAAKEFIVSYCSKFNKDSQQIFKWIVDKSLKNNVGITMINKAFGYEFLFDSTKHYMRCSVLSDKFNSWEKAYSQRKMDGMYIELSNSKIRTRSGQIMIS